MKKLKLVLASFVIAGLTLTSCSSDDSSGSSASIVGKWNPTKSVYKLSGANKTETYKGNEPGCPKDFIQFSEGNAFSFVVYNKNPSNECIQAADVAATYVKSENNLTITGGEYAGTYEVTKLTGSQLVVRATQNVGGATATTTLYLKKAAPASN